VADVFDVHPFPPFPFKKSPIVARIHQKKRSKDEFNVEVAYKRK
jgi:hypothetical protein